VTLAPPRGKRGLRSFLADEKGAAGALDFVATFPFALAIVMTTIQFLLVLNAYLFVRYASYYAARSACVVIPESTQGGERNEPTSAKKEIIREAAALAVSPVSPTRAMAGLGALGAKYYRGVQAISLPVAAGASSYSRFSVLTAKFSNALVQTEARMRDAPGRYDTFDPVAVEVTYYFHLGLPFAQKILSDGSNRLGKTVTLRSTCVMMNEGATEKPSESALGVGP
jgi:hypothetical protein